MLENYRILLIDDCDDDREFIQEVLTSSNVVTVSLKQAENGAEGLDLIQHHYFDCVLLDYSLPGQNGINILSNIRKLNAEVPVVVMTGQGSEAVAVTAMKSGAQDYITKDNLSFDRLIKTIDEAIQQRKEQYELLQRANFDHLTGVAGRALFYDRLELSIVRHKRTGLGLAVVFADLNKFKRINDKYGHAAGDRVLQKFAERLQNASREGDTVARLSGDEFVLILENLHEDFDENCQVLLSRLRQQVGVIELDFNGEKVTVSASLGAAIYPTHGQTKEELMEAADRAMYQVKHSLPPAG